MCCGSKTGKGIRCVRLWRKNVGDLAVTSDFEKELFEGESCIGKQVKWSINGTETMTVSAVTSPIRQNEFKVSTPCFYGLMRTDEEVVETVSWKKAENMDCLVRMKDGFKADGMDTFLDRMGERLEVNNLYVSCVIPLEEQRPVILKGRLDNLKKKTALVGFMLVNVFFGIVGTFWLRTQYRRGELGLRSALGASQGILKRYLDVEGLSLLAFTVPLVLVFIVNILYFDLPDTGRMAYSGWRFLVTFGGAFLLLAGMIWSVSGSRHAGLRR